MSKIKIEFEEVAGYPQLGTIRLWEDDVEIVEGLVKGETIRQFMLNMP